MNSTQSKIREILKVLVNNMLRYNQHDSPFESTKEIYDTALSAIIACVKEKERTND